MLKGKSASFLLVILAFLWACADTTAAKTAEEIRAQVEQWQALRAAGQETPRLPVTAGGAAFYAARDFEPGWNDPEYRRQLHHALQALENDGLNPRDYGIAELEYAGAADGADAATRDMRITRYFLRALMHLRRGKVDPHTLDARWNLEPRSDDARAVVDAAVQALRSGRITQAFDDARPAHPGYTTLRAELARLRALAAQGGWADIPDSPVLEPGISHADVLLLRRRLFAAGYLPAEATRDPAYDEALAQAIRRFQSEHYLEETGTVGPRTRAALNVSVWARIDQLRVNLERARWILPEIHGDLVLVDIAGFRVHILENARSVWQSRVQVGQSVRPTPIFKSAITHVTFNPAWTVPPGILRKDIAPKARRNPDYLRQNRLHVYDVKGRELDADDVDWKSPRGITVRQDPFPGGALGRVAIRFPNPYMVYLHETPHTRLFSEAQRTFSSGCIRTEKTYELAGRLLGWDAAELDRHVARGNTHDVKLPAPMTILLLYWTVDLREDGRVSFKPDPYRQDPRTLAALDQPPAEAGF